MTHSHLTEGEEVHEWRVSGEPGHGYPSYKFTFRSDDPRWEDSEAKARQFIALQRGDWADGPHLDHRTVTYSVWERL